jgi:hypothetical protein
LYPRKLKTKHLGARFNFKNFYSRRRKKEGFVTKVEFLTKLRKQVFLNTNI